MGAKIGVIGGSGLYQLEGSRKIEELELSTPFGLPSDNISIVDVGGEPVAFLPRHGKGHRLLPTEVPTKANIWALKRLGVEQILSVSAVGSLTEDYQPGDFVVCDQLIDRTKHRVNSFFGSGLVGHVAFADPYCAQMREAFIKVMADSGHSVHPKGTLVVMEGPLFSTRAESFLYKSWGAHLIGMTALPEAKLAREAEICFAVVAMITDYDCWKEAQESVTIEMVLKVMADNTKAIQKLIPDIVAKLKAHTDCDCRRAAEHALMTDPKLIPPAIKRELALFYQKYWS